MSRGPDPDLADVQQASIATHHRHAISEEVPYKPHKSPNNRPVVTVFGSGVAGLTAAHELIQRGFAVQVLEPEDSPFDHYGVKVGGLAASQPARLKRTRRLHWMLYERQDQVAYLAANPYLRDIPEEGALMNSAEKLETSHRKRLLNLISSLRELPMQRVQTRYPFTQSIATPVVPSTMTEDDVATLTLSATDYLNIFDADADVPSWQLCCRKLLELTKPDFVVPAAKARPGAKTKAKAKAKTRAKAKAKASTTARQTNSLDYEKELWDFLGAIPDLHGEIQGQFGELLPNYVNDTKLEEVCLQIVSAIIEFSVDLRNDLKRIRREFGEIRTVDVDQIRRREILLIEITGNCNLWVHPDHNAAYGRAWATLVKKLIVDSIREAVTEHKDAESEAGSSDGEDDLIGTVDGLRDIDGGKGLKERISDKLAAVDPTKLRSEVQSHEDEFTETQWKQLIDDLSHVEDFLEVAVGSDIAHNGTDDTDELIATNCVEFRVVEHTVLGEHGFRFFPGFYRHVFDTMKRTPLLDEGYRETGRSLFHQLVEPPPVRLGIDDGDQFHEFRETSKPTLEEMRRNMEFATKKLGFTLRDQLRYQVQFLKYMTSCDERRQMYENFSWWEFVDGKSEYDRPDPEGAAYSKKSGYSETGRKFICDLPQLLVAMSANECDALTNGNISVQMTIDTLQTGGAKDRMLNGPTTVSWLLPWKRFLKRQGVRFFKGGLDYVQWEAGYADREGNMVPEQLIPVIKGPGIATLPVPESPFDVFVDNGSVEPTPDFYVSALPFTSQTETVWRINGFEDIKVALDQLIDRYDQLPCDEQGLKDVEQVCEIAEEAISHLLHSRLDKVAQAFRIARDFYVNNQVRFHRNRYMLPMLPMEPASLNQKLSAVLELNQNRASLDVWQEKVEELEKAFDEFSKMLTEPVSTFSTMQRALHLLHREIRFINSQDEALIMADARLLAEGVVHSLRIGSKEILDLPQAPLREAMVAASAAFGSSKMQALKELDGDFVKLLNFDIESARRDRDGNLRYRRWGSRPNAVERTARGMPRPRFSYPMRDLTGAQYYFKELVRVGHAHFVLPSSTWGITGVGQVYFWKQRPSVTHGYIGQMSVDIADFYELDHQGGTIDERKTAWNCNEAQFSQRVWEQIVASSSADYASVVSQPRYYQIDSGLEFGSDGCSYNANMLMINLPGKFQYRPGLDTQPGELHKVSYEVSNIRWVMAGTYMATNTRLTTMEAADESGRQAVNAILLKLYHTNRPQEYNGGGTFVGDFCDIYPPEQNEIDSLDVFKRIDKDLFERRVPHFLDVLKVLDAVDAIPTREDPYETPAYNLSEVIELSLLQNKKDWSFLPEATSVGPLALDAMTADIRKVSKYAAQVMDVILKTVKQTEEG